MKAKFLSKKFWIALTTVACIALALCYYLFVVVASQQDVLTEKGYRELRQIDKNLGGRIRDLKKTADFTSKSLRLHSLGVKELNQGKVDTVDLRNKLRAVRNYIKQLNLDSTFTIHHVREDNDLDSNGFLIYSKNNWYLELTYDKIVEGSFNKDFFDEFVVIQENLASKETAKENCCDPCVKRDSKDKSTLSTKILFQTFSNQIKLKSPDSLLRSSHGIQSGGLLDVVIDDENYKVFVYRTRFNNEQDWTLLGFMKSSTFRGKSYEVNHGLLFSIFLIIAVLLLALPVLKLAVMSGAERLQMSNVVSIGLSVTVGTAVMVLIALSMTDYLKSEMATVVNFDGNPKNKVRGMAHTIHRNFNYELDSILAQLRSLNESKAYDTITTRYNKKKGFKNYKNLIYDKSIIRIITDTVEQKLLTSRKHYNQIIWIDSAGNQVLQKSRDSRPQFVVLPNLTDRDYFGKIKTKKAWTRETSRLSSKKRGKRDTFYIQSIISWVDNASEAAVSIPASSKGRGRPICLAMATPLLCMKDPILPPGYSICIINSQGEVQFHSDHSKNLKENLKEETEQNNSLNACLNSRASDTFEANYLGSEHLFSIKPIEGTELFAVAYYDLEHYRMPIQIAMITAVILIMAMYMIAGICLLLFFIASYRTTKLKSRPFFLQWLGPRNDKDFLLCCQSLAFTNFCFCLIPFLVYNGSELVYLCFLIIPVHIIYFTFILFESKGSFRVRSKTAIMFTVLIFSLVVVLDLISISTESNSSLWFYPVANVVIFASYWLLYLAANRVIRSHSFQCYFPFAYTLRYYFLFLISWLIVASVVPTLCFYRIGLVNGSIMTARNDLVETSEKFSVHPETIKLNACSSKDSLSAYTRAARIRPADILVSKDNVTTKTEKLLTAVVVDITRLSKKGKHHKFTHSSDTTWQSKYDEKQNKLTTTYRGKGNEASIALNYSIANFSIYSYFNLQNKSGIALSIALFIAFILFLYLLLRFVTRRVFGIDVFCDNKACSETFGSKREQVIFLKQQFDSLPKISMIGLPQCGKGTVIKNLKKRKGFREINWKSDVSKEVNELVDGNNPKKVILTHFEYGINNHEINQKKLKLLEKLHNEADSKIIIVSTVQPVAILDFYETMIDRALSKDKADEEYKEIKDYRLAFRQWQNILSSFVTIYHPLVQKPLADISEYGNEQVEVVVRAELEYGTLLPTLEPLVAQHYNTLCAKGEDDIILQIETLAESYYQAMWNSFTRKEKLLLYDLAKDHFVNTGNIKEIKILMQKGVVKMTNSLQLMNKSFANFILSAVREDEELLMEQEMSQKGTWHTVQMVLILSLLGLAIFFTLAQQSLLQNFNTLLTVVGSVLALVARFGGIFGGSTKPKDA